MAATLAVARWDEQRLRTAFEREASAAGDAVAAWLNGPLQALQAVHGVFQAQPQLTREDMRRATAWWLQQPLHLQAIGFSERVPRAADCPASRPRCAPTGRPISVSSSARTGPPAPAAGDEVVAIRYIEPQQRNAAALGVNALSIDAAAEAIRRAQRSGQPSASAGFRLTQEAADQTGVVDLPRRCPAPASAPGRGVVFVTLRMDDALGALLPAWWRQLALVPGRP